MTKAHPGPPGILSDGEFRGKGRLLRVRRVRPQFDCATAGLWFRGDRFRTDLFNAYTLLLCDEHEFVAIMRPYVGQVSNNELNRQLRAWLGQEASHGAQHGAARVYLRRLGLRFRKFHELERFVYYRVLFPALRSRQRVALIAGLEHFNTLLGEMCLCKAEYFDATDSELSLLLRWHFAEEIEHRAVVHDVADDLGVGYFTRVAMGIVAFVLYPATLFVTAFWFAAQTGDALRWSFYRGWFRFLFFEERFAAFFLSYFGAYLAPGFHPLKRASDPFAERALAGVS